MREITWPLKNVSFKKMEFFRYCRTKRMSLHCLKCFLWIALIRISSQHREEGSDANHLKITNNSMMKNVSYSVKPSPNNCACHSQGEIYNLAPLQNTDGTPSLNVSSAKYPGFSYSYNPCSPFRLGPKDGGCQKDVAICWWVRNGLPETYVTIGNQDKASCVKDKCGIPSFMYRTTGEYKDKKPTVRLKCDVKKRRKDEAVFEILSENEWIFQLTHLCSCANGCLINPDTPTQTTPPDPSYLPRIVIPVAVSAGTALVLVPFLVWLIGKMQKRRINNGDERRPLLGNRARADQQEPNVIPERNPIPERHPIPVSSAGRAEGSSSIESDANISSANV